MRDKLAFQTAAAPCGCGGPDCGECKTDYMARPRFFAGQLLTEDDLEQLISYVTAKARLHNRHLHGAGVVCGLEVSCDPCGGGKVVVHPGYALDCCGNDILVACKQEVDINQRIRRLRAEKLGADCGDPCEDGAVKDEADRVDASGERLRPAAREYCLYLRYCEQGTDPVAPYASGDVCGAQACEPTRIREGYKFELRCPEEKHADDDLLTRLRACISDLAGAEKATSDAQSYDRLATRTETALLLHKQPEKLRFTADDIETIAAGPKKLEEFAARVENKEAKEAIDEVELAEVLDEYQAVAATTVRYRLLSPKVRKELAAGEKGIGKLISAAVASIQSVSPALEKLTPELSLRRDRELATTLRTEALRLAAPEQPEIQPTAENFLFANAVPYTAQFSRTAVRDLSSLRQWLLARIDEGPKTDCALRRDVECLRLPTGSDLPAKEFARCARRLLELILRYLLDCLCWVLNPPCPPCEDSAVLLACLEVEECEVVSICNLERTYVLSATAFRYWLPLFRWIGEAFENLCCDLRKKLRVRKPTKTVDLGFERRAKIAQFSSSTPPAAFLAGNELLPKALNLTGISKATATSFINFSANVGRIAVESPIAAGIELPKLDLPLGGRDREGRQPGGDGSLIELLEQPATRGVVEEFVDDRIARTATEQEEALEKKILGFKPQIDRIERGLKSRPTNSALERSRVVRALRSDNGKLRDTIGDLEKRLLKLEGKVK